jgi:hypothetical protein
MAPQPGRLHFIAKFLIGILLLPVCAALAGSLYGLLDGLAVENWREMEPNTLGLLVGFFLWIIVYLAMPRPVWSYVLAHELTHALWGAAMGAQIKGIKVTGTGGHVKLTRTNMWITLAPYFFPLYTVIVLLLYLFASRMWDMTPYQPVWLGWVGLTWGFHATFTGSILRIRQPDIHEHGRLFSYVIIFIFNVLGLCIGVTLLTDTSWAGWLDDVYNRTLEAYAWVGDRFARIPR